MRRTLDSIRRGLAEVWDSGGRRFVTFELKRGGEPDPDVWIQWIDGTLNVRWRLEADPATELPLRGVTLPASARVQSWVAGGSLIVGVWDLRVDEVALLVESLFARILSDDVRFEVETRIDAA